MFYLHHYVGEAPCNGEGSDDRVGPHPQRVNWLWRFVQTGEYDVPKTSISCCNIYLVTVALCLSFIFLWYDMVWYSYAMVCYFYAMLWDIQNDMIWYAIVWYGMLCYEIWVNVPSFTEEFHLFSIFKTLIYRFFSIKTHF